MGNPNLMTLLLPLLLLLLLLSLRLLSLLSLFLLLVLLSLILLLILLSSSLLLHQVNRVVPKEISDHAGINAMFSSRDQLTSGKIL